MHISIYTEMEMRKCDFRNDFTHTRRHRTTPKNTVHGFHEISISFYDTAINHFINTSPVHGELRMCECSYRKLLKFGQKRRMR